MFSVRIFRMNKKCMPRHVEGEPIPQNKKKYYMYMAF